MIPQLLARVREALRPHLNQPAPPRIAGRRPASSAGENWWYFPPITDGGYQRIEVRTDDNYDFARLTWVTCARCRIALVAKIRVTDEWEGQGYAARMLLRAMRGFETYTWVTTTQSAAGQRFFRSMRKSTGAAFTPQAPRCEHMRAVRGAGLGKPRIENAPPL
ncbi:MULTISPECIES: hypothetical protein [unclassified Streptomyces]|uniref:hypothetical protein n=1 Tax=unclassified Streptomyces TaxID=2593676 RepID=UPI0036C7A424